MASCSPRRSPAAFRWPNPWRRPISTQVSRPIGRIFEAWVPVLLYTGLIFTLSSIPDLSPPGNLIGSDKLVHVCEYFIWGLLLRRALDRLLSGSPAANAISTVIVGAVLCFSDESFQRTVGRNYSYFDMAADVIGVVLSQITYAFIRRKLRGAES